MLMITDAEIIQQDEEQKITEYTVTGKAQLAGDSIWEYEGPLTVTVDSIREVVTTYEEDDEPASKMYYVSHDGGDNSWRMYTDTGFQTAISDLMDEDIFFTEQGMQMDGEASMEV